jgi:peptidoglycan hydrolase CwlO-like protein
MNIIEQIIMTVVTTLIGYFVGKRKSNAETDNQVLKNLELSIGLYKNMIDDLRVEIRELNVKIQELEKKVEELMSENKKLKRYNGI